MVVVFTPRVHMVVLGYMVTYRRNMINCDCDNRDDVILYTDGHSHCFSVFFGEYCAAEGRVLVFCLQ